MPVKAKNSSLLYMTVILVRLILTCYVH